ncbi:Murein DD-endopeptidase MepM and murein hydrolase activator NlpD, contain LysM domain [Capnocytophaga haemolytica]|jgi:peptidase M23|uniref:Glycyl-glycine endopeptidase ALE-1 n=1 Tax=Capnocytophaga haemolytica TaxID=45243 RepID=A0AAX2GZT8_9FLAO|nr:peptidoglycan DD-metalloendopeptidase family protein [Capnocytophaga haemolytica]SFN92946.1 Murein DD-endopeptidase MepM and murein hydrolase activator NlpD, contain LysM domain [Capnocytophaga haemolytica]SNV13030.1 Glycyl-glycine endopeptidase ALE-1 precursor [Capnocytophaga haemolytica]
MNTLIQKITLAGLAVLTLSSCGDEKKNNATTTQSPTTEVVQAPKFEYGFNLNDFTIVKDTIKSGDTFGQILEKNHVDVSEIHNISAQTKQVIDPRSFRAGHVYALLYDKKDPSKPHSFIYQPNIAEYVVVRMGDSVYARKESRKVTVVEREKAGYITSNLSEDARAAGLSANATYQLGQIFDYTIDFFRLQKGDNFKIIYQERYVDDTIFAGVERVKAAYFEHKGKPFYAFNFTTDSLKGKSGFYDENGNMMKRMFLQAPLDIFRITSKFGMRFHPVLHRMKGHFGTDYAAPSGTPIRVTASGTVIEAGYSSGNGNYVKVRHNGTYTTQYLHMSRIIARRGQHVEQGQVIGLVGSTGLATGPHVCYRFWKNGKQVNPLTEKMPNAVPIDAKLKKKYLKSIQPLKEQLDAIKATPIDYEDESAPILEGGKA